MLTDWKMVFGIAAPVKVDVRGAVKVIVNGVLKARASLKRP